MSGLEFLKGDDSAVKLSCHFSQPVNMSDSEDKHNLKYNFSSKTGVAIVMKKTISFY